MRKSIVVNSRSDDARLDDFINADTASTATSNQTNDIGQENLSKKNYNVLKNMSFEKLKNTELANMDSKILTRETSKNLGITASKDLQKCTGNKFISMDILNSVLSTLPSICRTCKSKNSIIDILNISVHEDPQLKHGLSEKLLFHCSNCNEYLTSQVLVKQQIQNFQVLMKSISGLFLHLFQLVVLV